MVVLEPFGAQSDSAMCRMRPLRLLLVDGNPTLRQILAGFLQRDLRVQVVGTAGEAEAALSLARELRPEIVVLDLVMPGRSGLEILPHLRELLPAAGIVVLTLLDTRAHREAALAAGADAFVPKLTLDTDLLPAIQRVLRLSTAREE